MSFYGRFFRAARVVARRICRVDQIPPPGSAPEPCIYVCRHKNLRGPLYTMVNMPTPMHPWVLDVFCDKDICYRHYRDYTFTERYGWPRPLAVCVAKLASGVIPPLMRSISAIPVYRGSAKIMATCKRTIAALRRNECVVIYPDIDYTDTGDGEPALYQGYLLLDRLYRRVEGKPLSFVPLNVDVKGRRIAQGEPVRFDERAQDYAAERKRVGEAIADGIAALSREMAVK